VLEEEAALLEGAEESQVMGSKCKEVAAEMRRCNDPPRRLGESNWGSTAEVRQ